MRVVCNQLAADHLLICEFINLSPKLLCKHAYSFSKGGTPTLHKKSTGTVIRYCGQTPVQQSDMIDSKSGLHNHFWHHFWAFMAFVLWNRTSRELSSSYTDKYLIWFLPWPRCTLQRRHLFSCVERVPTLTSGGDTWTNLDSYLHATKGKYICSSRHTFLQCVGAIYIHSRIP